MSDNIKKYKDKDGKTKYKFQVYLGIDPLTGKKKRTNRQGFNTLREAKIAKARLLTGVEKTKIEHLTFNEVYNEWWKTYKLGLKATTVYNKECIYSAKLQPIFGNYHIDKITKPIIQKYVNEIISSKSYTVQYTLLKQVLNYALSEGYIDKLPYQGVIVSRKIVEEVKSEPYEYWSDDKVLNFLEVVKNNYSIKWYALFRLFVYTGMRLTEATSLHWEDIDFENNTVNLKRRAKMINGAWDIDTLKTKKSERVVTVDKETLLHLKKWKLKQKFLYNKSNIVFTNKTGEYLNSSSVYIKLNKINKKFNFGKYKIHAFRHNHTSMLVRAGVPLEQISERLGHSDIKTTLNIYNHISKKQKSETVELLLKYLEK